jgi:hypothetical protein
MPQQTENGNPQDSCIFESAEGLLPTDSLVSERIQQFVRPIKMLKNHLSFSLDLVAFIS